MQDLVAFQGSSLCVVGNVNRDLKTSPFPATAQLLDDGESSVARISETIGGGGANSACVAATLGARTSFIGKVGGDPLGQQLQRTLKKQGVETYLAVDRRHPTGTSVALNYANGQRHFVSCLPASQSFEFGDVDLAALGGGQHLLRADIWFSSAMLFGGNEQLLRRARGQGLATSMDLNWDPQWSSASRSQIEERKAAVRTVLPWIDLVHGNSRELQAFAGATDLDTSLQRLVEWGAGAVIVHLGPAGAGYYCAGTWVTEPAVPVHAHVHSAGTGDVLSVSMMLLHHRTDIPIPERLRLSNTIVSEYMEGRRVFIPELMPLA